MGSGDGNTTIENGSELLFTKIVDDKDQIAIFRFYIEIFLERVPTSNEIIL